MPPKNHFLVNFGPKTLKYFILNETWYISAFKGAHSEFDNCFLKFHPQNTFFGQTCPETSKSFVLNETRHVSIFKEALSEFNNFLKFRSQITYFGQNLSQNFKVLCFK